MAIWDPTALADPDATRALARLADPTFAWDAVQIRDRRCVATADVKAQLAVAARQRRCQIWVNRDPELAIQLNADGVVCDPSEINPQSSRRQLLPLHRIQDLDNLPTGTDLVMLGHILATPSKPGTPGIGWQALTRIAAAAPVPVLAVGGLDLNLEAQVHDAGAWGLAAIRAAFAVSGRHN